MYNNYCLYLTKASVNKNKELTFTHPWVLKHSLGL